MSGCSSSTSRRASAPSVDTTTENPRTVRFERIRSTMLRSSSTSEDAGGVSRRTRRAGRPRGERLDGSRPGPAPTVGSGSTAIVAAVGLDDAAGDRRGRARRPTTSSPPGRTGWNTARPGRRGSRARGRRPGSSTVPCRPADGRPRSPARPSPWRAAFSSRFTKTCSSRSWSPQTGPTPASTATVDRSVPPGTHADGGLDDERRGRTSRSAAGARRCRAPTSRAGRRPAGPCGPTRPR